MTGTLWAIGAGVGYGIFQTFNRRAVRGLDVYVSTFMQLFIGALVLAVISMVTADLTLLQKTSIWGWIYFSLAGFIHFLLGWTFFNASQKKIGAARTGSLIGTMPLFATVTAALFLQEYPTLMAVGGVFLIVGGVYLVNYSRLKHTTASNHTPNMVPGETGFRSLLFGLAVALCWSISPVFTRYGLVELHSPILGVTIGITASAVGYGVALVARSTRSPIPTISMDAFVFKVIAGVLVGLATWAYWTALDLIPVAMVLALSLLSVPVVNLLSPLLVGHELERVTAQVWLGSGLIIGGSLILILFR